MQVGVKMSSVRATRLGQVWLPPPPQSGMEPDCIPDLESFRLLLSSGDLGMAKKGIGNRMVQRFKGISPSLATEMCIASGIEYEKDVEIIEPQHWQNVYEKWSQWLSCLQERRFLCSWSTCGGYSMLGTYPVKEASALTFVRSYYKKFEEKQEFEKVYELYPHRIMFFVIIYCNKVITKLLSVADQAEDSSRFKRCSRQIKQKDWIFKKSIR